MISLESKEVVHTQLVSKTAASGDEQHWTGYAEPIPRQFDPVSGGKNNFTKNSKYNFILLDGKRQKKDAKNCVNYFCCE